MTLANCSMVLAPVLLECSWSLYVWNFQHRKIVVIDPVEMFSGYDKVMRKHEENVDKMHEAMTNCKEHFFPNPLVNMDGWRHEFLSVNGANGLRSYSGLYTMFYARYFDGNMITRILTTESQELHRCNILHQLLSMQQNIGQLPPLIKDALAVVT